MGSILRKFLTEVVIKTENVECNLMGETFNLANLVLIIKVTWVSTIPRQVINTSIIKIIQPVY